MVANKGFGIFAAVLKKAIAILVFSSLFCQCVVQLGIFAWYEWNKDYVAKNLCENRNKPAMKCCGKCYLKKQIKNVSGDTGNSSEHRNKTEHFETDAFIIPHHISFERSTYTEVSSYYSIDNSHYQFLYHKGVFHPPTQAA